MVSKELKTQASTYPTSGHTKSEIEEILLSQCEYMIEVIFEYKNIVNDGKVSKAKKKIIAHKMYKALANIKLLYRKLKI